MNAPTSADVPTWVAVQAETTGLAPQQHRILEIALVVLDEGGRPMGEAATLVNPGGPIDPAARHGLGPQDVADAPPFGDIAGWLLRWLSGKVLVGHNLLFTIAFLEEEFRRAGLEMPHVPAICTRTHAPRYLPELAGRSLEQCCAAAGLDIGSPRTALTDARAAAALFAYFLDRRPALPSQWRDFVTRARKLDWPDVPMRNFTMAPRSVVAPPRPAPRRTEPARPSPHRAEPATPSPYPVEPAKPSPRPTGRSRPVTHRSEPYRRDPGETAPTGELEAVPDDDPPSVAEHEPASAFGPGGAGRLHEVEPATPHPPAREVVLPEGVDSFSDAVRLKDIGAALAHFEAERVAAHREIVRDLDERLKPGGRPGAGRDGGRRTDGARDGGPATDGTSSGGADDGGADDGGARDGGARDGGTSANAMSDGGAPEGGAHAGGAPVGGASVGGASVGGASVGGVPAGSTRSGRHAVATDSFPLPATTSAGAPEPASSPEPTPMPAATQAPAAAAAGDIPAASTGTPRAAWAGESRVGATPTTGSTPAAGPASASASTSSAAPAATSAVSAALRPAAAQSAPVDRAAVTEPPVARAAVTEPAHADRVSATAADPGTARAGSAAGRATTAAGAAGRASVATGRASAASGAVSMDRLGTGSSDEADGAGDPVPAGWYPDPRGDGEQLRWWDGTAWTHHTHG